MTDAGQGQGPQQSGAAGLPAAHELGQEGAPSGPAPGAWPQATGSYPAAPTYGAAPPPYGAPGPYPGAGSGRPAKTSAAAVVSLILSILWIGGLGSLIAVILGFVSRHGIKKSEGTKKGKGVALAGIIIGFIGLLGAAAIGTGVAVVVNDVSTPVTLSYGQSQTFSQNILNFQSIESMRVGQPVTVGTQVRVPVSLCIFSQQNNSGTNQAQVIRALITLHASDGSSVQPETSVVSGSNLALDTYFDAWGCESGSFYFQIDSGASPTYFEAIVLPHRYQWSNNG